MHFVGRVGGEERGDGGGLYPAKRGLGFLVVVDALEEEDEVGEGVVDC